jgi:hypothetical protein
VVGDEGHPEAVVAADVVRLDRGRPPIELDRDDGRARQADARSALNLVARDEDKPVDAPTEKRGDPAAFNREIVVGGIDIDVDTRAAEGSWASVPKKGFSRSGMTSPIEWLRPCLSARPSKFAL